MAGEKLEHLTELANNLTPITSIGSRSVVWGAVNRGRISQDRASLGRVICGMLFFDGSSYQLEVIMGRYPVVVLFHPALVRQAPKRYRLGAVICAMRYAVLELPYLVRRVSDVANDISILRRNRQIARAERAGRRG